MAHHSDNILEKARAAGLATPSAGMKVPDGYFSDFTSRMDAMLPYRPEIENPKAVEESERPRTLWQKVRPYVYMAAMFAGVWCMLQMFSSLSRGNGLQPLEENTGLAKAISGDEFMKDYIYDDINSWDLVDEMMEDGTLDSDSALNTILSEDTELPAENTEYILPQ